MLDMETGAATAAAEPISAPESQAPTPSIEDTMAAVYEKHNPARGDGGRFAGSQAEPAPDAAAEATTESTDQPQDTTTEPAEAPAIVAPNAWSAEMKAEFAKLPPSVRDYIAKRESEAHAAITQKGEQASRFEPIAKAIEPYRSAFERNGVSPAQGVQRLLEVNAFIQKDPAAGIRWIAEQMGVDIGALTGGQPAQGQTQVDPQLQAVTKDLNQLKAVISRGQQEQEAATRAAMAKEIETFKVGKADFAELEQDMAKLIDSGHATTLDDAYEKARWANPTTRTRILEDQRKADEEKRRKEAEAKTKDARKHQSINVRSGQGGSPGKAMTIEETLSAAYDRAAAG